ncbi:MAG: N-acetylneuraminate synthase family protein [Candidatus Micrarchaeota archaeon]
MVKPSITIGKDTISEDSACYVIAEIGHNHQGSMDLAKKMVDAAAQAGANAVKLQKRSNKDLFTAEMYAKPYENENSFGKTYGEHREALEFGEEQYKELKAYADSKGVTFFATPFDIPSADFLENVGVPAYKIASAMVTDIPLIEHVAKKGKPILLSTGTCTLEDVDRAYECMKSHGVPMCILHCVAAYPMMDYSEANLSVISALKERYPDAVIGFSSHESGIMLPVAAYMLGARVVEKHFTLNRAMKGTDQTFSLEPQGLSKMVRDLKRIHQALGDGNKIVQRSEMSAKQKLGKSIFARTRIPKGTIVAPEMVIFKSPATGLPPYKVDDVLGREAKSDIPPDTPIDYSLLGDEKKQSFGKVDWGALLGGKS